MSKNFYLSIFFGFFFNVILGQNPIEWITSTWPFASLPGGFFVTIFPWINPIIHEKKKRKSSWRLDPKISGISSCVADIGTHAFNMLELVTGLKVHKVLSDINSLYNDNPLDIDANILVRMNNGAKGVIRSSQIATGEENNLRVNILSLIHISEPTRPS